MPLITITRSVGCGGTAIARRVADTLGVGLFDDRALEELAAHSGLAGAGTGALAERAPGLLDQLASNRPQEYLDLMQALVYDVARQGNGVILGHGSQILLREFGCALHVRVFAPEEYRVRHLAELHGLTAEAAARRIHRSDHQRRGFLRYAYHLDWNDLSLYDLVINRAKTSIELAAELIAVTARSREIRECGASALEAMGRLALARRVEAALLEEGASPHEVYAEVPSAGVVRLTGVVGDEELRKRVAARVSATPGVNEVVDGLAVVKVRAD